MAFGLTNTVGTFQRLMCHIFREFLRIFLEVYVDDLCVHSKQRSDHQSQLKSVFDKCQLYQLCLNPGKVRLHGETRQNTGTYSVQEWHLN